MSVDYDVRGQEEIDFFTGGITIMDYGFVFRPEAKLKHLHDEFVSFKMLIDGLEWCGLLWCFYQLFALSFWRHPFTAEEPFVSKWCNATFL